MNNRKRGGNRARQGNTHRITRPFGRGPEAGRGSFRNALRSSNWDIYSYEEGSDHHKRRKRTDKNSQRYKSNKDDRNHHHFRLMVKLKYRGNVAIDAISIKPLMHSSIPEGSTISSIQNTSFKITKR